MREFLDIAKALSDSNRVRILLSLRKQELCVCQITALLELAPSTVSKHLSILRHAGLIDMRKAGRWAYYRLADTDISPVARKMLDMVFETVESSRQAQIDGDRTLKILQYDPKDLCCRPKSDDCQSATSDDQPSGR
jgi:DNA-binding transcriptional ArsR family regulator